MQVREYFLISVLLFSFNASYSKADIVGGDEVQDSDPIRSSTVGLFEPDGSGRGGALCTASIIGKNTALTAAHCLQPGGAPPVLLFGPNLHSPETIKRPVTDFKVNPLWNKRRGKGMDEGDIALVKFGGGLPGGYRQARINRSDSNLTKGEAAVLAGYGISDSRSKSGSGILRKTSISIANPRRGKSEMILDQSHGRGACHGDSGGPAFVNVGGKSILAGVTNRSYPASAPDDCGHKVVYTKVNAYQSWIKKEQKALGASATAASAPDRYAKKRGTGLLKTRSRSNRVRTDGKTAKRPGRSAPSGHPERARSIAHERPFRARSTTHARRQASRPGRSSKSGHRVY